MIKAIVITAVILGVLAFGALNYHFILLDDGLKVLQKAEITLDSTFVDARGTKRLKLILNPALVRAGIKDVLRKEGIEIKR